MRFFKTFIAAALIGGTFTANAGDFSPAIKAGIASLTAAGTMDGSECDGMIAVIEGGVLNCEPAAEGVDGEMRTAATGGNWVPAIRAATPNALAAFGAAYAPVAAAPSIHPVQPAAAVPSVTATPTRTFVEVPREVLVASAAMLKPTPPAKPAAVQATAKPAATGGSAPDCKALLAQAHNGRATAIDRLNTGVCGGDYKALANATAGRCMANTVPPELRALECGQYEAAIARVTGTTPINRSARPAQPAVQVVAPAQLGGSCRGVTVNGKTSYFGC